MSPLRTGICLVVLAMMLGVLVGLLAVQAAVNETQSTWWIRIAIWATFLFNFTGAMLIVVGISQRCTN
jgi:hypothetical protein